MLKKNKSTLSERCLQKIKEIPKGKVTTYKLLAESLNTKAYQAIGQILTRNPNLITTPCHRVVKSTGEVGGYVTGVADKIALLKSEGIEISGTSIQDFEKVLFDFKNKSIQND